MRHDSTKPDLLHLERCQRVGMPSWTRPLKACKKVMRASCATGWCPRTGGAPGSLLDLRCAQRELLTDDRPLPDEARFGGTLDAIVIGVAHPVQIAGVDRGTAPLLGRALIDHGVDRDRLF